MDRYIRAMDWIYLACIWIAGISLLIMTLVIPYGVFMRYWMNDAASWPEPLSVLLMVLFTFIAAAACYRSESHIAVKLLTERLPDRLRPWSARLVDALMLLLSLFMVIWGIDLVKVTWHQVIAEFPTLSVGVTYLPLPVGGALTLLFIVERMLAGSQVSRPVVDFDSTHAEIRETADGGDAPRGKPVGRLTADNVN
jgi:TRAP-type C4-dicarboxylate transport system permease small subunit